MKLRLPLMLLGALMACFVYTAQSADYSPGTANVSLGSADRLWSDSATTAQTGSITLTGNTVIGGAADYTISGIISDGEGEFGFTKKGTNKVTLTGANTYDGDTIIEAGILGIVETVANSAIVPVLGKNGKILNGATLEIGERNAGFNGGSNAGGTYDIEGTGSNGQGAIFFNSSQYNNGFGPTINLTGDATIKSVGKMYVDTPNSGTVTTYLYKLGTTAPSATLTLNGGACTAYQILQEFTSPNLNLTLTSMARMYSSALNLELGVIKIDPTGGINPWALHFWNGKTLTMGGLDGGGNPNSHTTGIYFNYNAEASGPLGLTFKPQAGETYAWHGDFQRNTTALKNIITVDGPGTQIITGSWLVGNGNQSPATAAATAANIKDSSTGTMGEVIIKQGTLQVGGQKDGTATVAAEMAVGKITIASGDGQTGTLAFNTTTNQNYRSSDGIIGGTGALILLKQTNTANITLTAGMANYQGKLKVQGGTLTMAAANALHANAAFELAGGILDLSARTAVLGNTVSITGNSTLKTSTAGLSNVLLSRGVTITAPNTLTLATGQTFTLSGSQANTTWNGTFALNGGTFKLQDNLTESLSGLTADVFSFTGTSTLDLTGLSDPGQGRYLIFTGTNGVSGFSESSSLTLTGITITSGTCEFIKTGNSIYLNISSDVPRRIWTGGAEGTWQFNVASDPAWGGTPYTTNSVRVEFNDQTGVSASLVKIAADVAPERLTVNNTQSGTAYTLQNDGGKITGSTIVIKNGDGSLIISGQNDYDGGTTISEGTVTAKDGTALGKGPITLGATGGNPAALVWESTAVLDAASTISFEGGILKYGTSSSADLSTAFVTGGDNTIFKVDTNGNDIVWSKNLSSGGFLKTGLGDLKLTSSATAYAKNISLLGGSLTFAPVGATPAIAISGAISGTGTITLDEQTRKRFTVTGNNSGFTGTWVLNGNGDSTQRANEANDVGFNTNSLGAGSTLTLNGRGFYLNGFNTTDVNLNLTGKGWINGSSGQAYTFSGKLTGAGELTTPELSYFATYILTGDMKGFSGTISTQSTYAEGPSVWQFGNNTAAVKDADNQIFASSGNTVLLGNRQAGANALYRFSYSDQGQVVVNAAIGGTTVTKANVEQAGAGTLVLGKDNLSTGILTITSGKVQLGNAGASGNWIGIIAGAGDLAINRSAASAVMELNAANTYTGETVIENGNVKTLGVNSFGTGAKGITLKSGSIDFNSQAVSKNLTVQGGNLSNAGSVAGNVTVAATAAGDISLGHVRGIRIAGLSNYQGSSITDINGSVTLSTASLSLAAGNVEGSGDKAVIQFDSTASVLTLASLSLGLNADIVTLMQTEGTYNLLITNGKLAGDITTASDNLTYDNVTINPLLAMLGYTISSVNTNGYITITGDSSGNLVYTVGASGRTLEYSQELNPYVAAMIDGTLNITWAAGSENTTAILKNINGDSTSALINLGTNSNTLLVIDNDLALDSVYAGSVSGAGSILKTGASDQTIGGSVNIGGGIELEEGSLTINGTTTASHVTASQGSLTLGGNGNTLGAVNLDGDADIALNGSTTINKSGTLADNSSIAGNGALTIAQGGSLSLEDSSYISVGALTINGGLNFGSETSTVSSLAGTGTLSGDGGSLVMSTSGKAAFQGTMSGNGTLVMNGGGTQSFIGAGNKDMSIEILSGTVMIEKQGGTANYKSLNVASGATLLIGDSSSSIGTETTQLSLAGPLNFDNGARLDVFFTPLATMPAIFSSDTINLGDQLAINLINNGDTNGAGGSIFSFTLIESSASISGSADVVLSGPLKSFFETVTSEIVNASGGGQQLVVKAVRSASNTYVQYANSTNSMAGANILWDVGLQKMPVYGTDLYSVMECITDAISAGNEAWATQTLAAVAGSTITSLVSTQRADTRAQMAAIRDRIIQMGLSDGYVYEDAPYFHAWIYATGGYSKHDTSGDKAGHTLDTWGGTVGFDMNIDNTFTIGAAFTANNNKIKSNACDWADGENNGYYVNLFARASHKNWSHILLLTGGWHDAELDRTVVYCPNGGFYKTHGETSGSVWSAMYEIAYDIVLNESRTSILQPLATIGFTTAKMDDYTETSAGNAGLHASNLDGTIGTVGVGVRWHGTFGQNLFNRASYGELRAIFTQDFGDTQPEGMVTFDGVTGGSKIQGTKVGSSAILLGAGLTIPLAEQTSVFANGNLDLRSKAVSVSGNIGLRYDF